jgi:hypothetical protein
MRESSKWIAGKPLNYNRRWLLNNLTTEARDIISPKIQVTQSRGIYVTLVPLLLNPSFWSGPSGLALFLLGNRSLRLAALLSRSVKGISAIFALYGRPLPFALTALHCTCSTYYTVFTPSTVFTALTALPCPALHCIHYTHCTYSAALRCTHSPHYTQSLYYNHSLHYTGFPSTATCNSQCMTFASLEAFWFYGGV